MPSSIKNKLYTYLKFDDARSGNIKKNILYTFPIKALSILIGFLLPRLILNYVNAAQYGIWFDISTIVAWITTFDIGLSNGLRNKIAYELALGREQNIAKYTSTTFAILALIAGLIFVVFFTIGSFFNWNNLLNIHEKINLWPLMLIALSCFCIQFTLQPINTILTATHQPFKSSLILLLTQVVTYLLTYLLVLYTDKGNLLNLVIAISVSPVVVLMIANIYLFATQLKLYIPKLKLVNFKYAKELLFVGSTFFFIQIGGLIFYQTDNIIITRTLGPEAVTVFNLAFKLFSVLNIAFAIIVTPYWSAFTDAYAKSDMQWIVQSLKKMRKIWLVFVVLTILLYFMSFYIYPIWIGNSITISPLLSLSMAIYVIVFTWQSMQVAILNGTGKLRVQLILIFFTAVLNIPLSIYLIQIVGVAGTVIANVIATIIMNVFFTYQCRVIINGTAKGIWLK